MSDTRRTDPVRAHRTLVEMAATGYHDDEIGEHFGVSARTIRRWRRAAGIASGHEQVPHQVEHGTPAGYRSGCRQPCCRAAATEDQATRRARYQAETARTAVNAYTRWTVEQDRVALTYPIREAAAELGRTYLAVANRRAHLVGLLERQERP